MRRVILVVTWLLALSPAAFGQDDQQSAGSGAAAKKAEIEAVAQKQKDAQQKVATAIEEKEGTKFVRTLTNVQIELTVSDYHESQPPEKKTVSMIVSSGNWGKIRSAATIMVLGEPPYPVELNVDARPFVAVDGQIQLELTFEYAPVRGAGDPKVGPKPKPAGINQSQTLVLQNGKPLTVSQAADPISDRKVVVEVKATILK
jgi:hypothetical protein